MKSRDYNEFIIKINLESLRKNPNAGRKVLFINGLTEIESKYIIKENDKYFVITKINEIEIRREIFKGKTPKKSLPLLLSKTISRTVEPVYLLKSEPKYLFSFIPTKIQCSFCNKKFFHTELLSDYLDDDTYTATECPKCHKWDCCNLKFEELSNINKND